MKQKSRDTTKRAASEDLLVSDLEASDAGAMAPISCREAIVQLRRRASNSGFRISRISSSSFAIVFRARSTLEPNDIAIKVFFNSAGGVSAGAATASFEALQRAQTSFGPSNALGVVKPICVLPELGAVITEWASGTTLQHWFKRCSVNEAGLIAGRAGAWLASLHGAKTGPSRSIDT